MPGSEFEPRSPHPKRKSNPFSFWVQVPPAAKLSLRRVIERESGNPQWFPFHTFPSLRKGGTLQYHALASAGAFFVVQVKYADGFCDSFLACFPCVSVVYFR